MSGKKIGRALLLLLLIFVLFLGVTLLVPGFKKEKNELGKYENVISEGVLNKDAKIVDIALLGAHDAFSNGIIVKSSPNINEGGIVNNKVINTVAKGFASKMSKAQIANAKQMLYKGVRYFDVRITKIDNEYYTFHGYLSNKLSYYVNDIVDFLNEHKKEYIIFDIQQFYTSDNDSFGLGEQDWLDLYNYLGELGLTNFINYSSSNSIDSLTYNIVTNNQTNGGVILLGKNSHSNTPLMYKRDGDANYDDNRNYDSIRSYWHDKIKTNDMLEGIEKEYNYVKEHSNKFDKVLVINQAQKTGMRMDIGIIDSIFGYSLINIAKNFNYKLVKDKDTFTKYLEYMPIFMVDYSTCDYKNFNSTANNYIIEFNKTL